MQSGGRPRLNHVKHAYPNVRSMSVSRSGSMRMGHPEEPTKHRHWVVWSGSFRIPSPSMC